MTSHQTGNILDGDQRIKVKVKWFSSVCKTYRAEHAPELGCSLKWWWNSPRFIFLLKYIDHKAPNTYVTVCISNEDTAWYQYWISNSHLTYIPKKKKRTERLSLYCQHYCALTEHIWGKNSCFTIISLLYSSLKIYSVWYGTTFVSFEGAILKNVNKTKTLKQPIC